MNHAADKKISINWRRANKLCGALIIILTVAYVISINDLSIQGFALQQSKNKISEMQKESEYLNNQMTNLSSFENISKRAKELKMVAVGKIDYIEVVGGAVAKK